MANSVVKVTDIKDDVLDDHLLLLVGEDGTVSPDKETVENYLKQKNGPTNIKIMKINHSEKQSIDISVDNVTYMPDVVNEEIVRTEQSNMDEVERNLYNFKLDHDYTPFTSPKGSPEQPQINEEEDDELAKTLSILDGPDPEIPIPISSSEPPPLVISTPQNINKTPKVKLIQSITITPASTIKPLTMAQQPLVVAYSQSNVNDQKKASVNDQNKNIDEPIMEDKPEEVESEKSMTESDLPITPMDAAPTSQLHQETPKGRAKVIKTTKQLVKPEKPKPARAKSKSNLEGSDDSEYSDEDFGMEMEDDENDSDFDVGEAKLKTPRRASQRTKSESKSVTPKPRGRKKLKGIISKEEHEKASQKGKDKPSQKYTDKVALDKEKDKPVSEQQTPAPPQAEQVEQKPPEKKPLPKKKKEIPKEILNDFTLFSTPDIIRRVGGKEPTTPNTPATPESHPTSKQPAKITQGSRGKSLEQVTSSPAVKTNRMSLDNKVKDGPKEKEKDKEKHHNKEKKNKERRISNGDKVKQMSVDEKLKKEIKPENRTERHSIEKKPSLKAVEAAENILNSDEMPSAEDIRSIILNEDTKSYTTSSIPMDTEPVTQNMDANNLNLDASGLDLDPTILDNLNNDEISEDILYQVAQSLVSNPELQNAIDKGINEGVLDPMAMHQGTSGNHRDSDQVNDDMTQKGTQIVRPDGRVVVIPPIERPTTRSRNKKKEDNRQSIFKPVHKPLDDEHVSGNELDSSNDEEESEDDPNKLWCICSQPHNNRFMICCDTCEEWYHGKCVNITKAMGQQMEAEGKEWICRYCKDPSLKRPHAAARRIRKASRNSRTSTDSTGSATKKIDAAAVTVKCVVCHKPARKNSIYCSETCILAHAQGIERVVVFERATGKMLTGNKAPSAANLDQWLKEHRGYEVLKSGGRVVTAKPGSQMTQSKLKLVKNVDDHGVSLAVQKKGVSLGVLKHAPKHPQQEQQQQDQKGLKMNLTGTKLSPKTPAAVKEAKTKLLTHPLIVNRTGASTTPPSGKKQLVQSTLTPTPKPSPQTTPTSTPKEKHTKEKTPKERTPKTPKSKQQQQQPEQQAPSAKQQEDIRENVEKTLFEQLTNRLKGCEELKLSEEEVKNISKEIETELFKCFGDTGQKYRNKYRSLIFNIKDAKNQTLWRRICEKSINPYELVRLSPDDLASQELALWREREAKHQLDMIKKSELELLNCKAQYVLKTHKGEQVVEDDRAIKVDNTEVIKSLTEGSTLDGTDAKLEGRDKEKKGGSKHGHKDKERDKERGKGKDKKSKDKEHRSGRSSSRDRSRDRSRRRSRSRSRDRRKDHKKHFRSKERDKEKNRDKERDRHHKSSHKSSRHKKDLMSSTDKLDKKAKEILEQLVDNKIVPPLEDRLWKHVPQDDIVPAVESDSDHEPTSTVTIPTPPRSQDDDVHSNVDKNDKEESSMEIEKSTSPPPKMEPAEIWKGIINMPDVAQISITAYEVSGDCANLNRELSPNLDIVGRISPDTVWDYIGKMKCSNSKGISLIRLNANNVEEKMPYLALYSYLSSRDRLGVVKSLNKAVKDFYIYPLAPAKPIPQVLLPLNGPGFEEQRPPLLLGIIVRDKRKRPLFELPSATAGMPSSLLAKKPKLEVPAVVAAAVAASNTPPRSYTPPPLSAPVSGPNQPTAVPAPVPAPTASAPQKDPRLKLALPPPLLPPASDTTPKDDEGDEPYSPGDSSPEMPSAMTKSPSLVHDAVHDATSTNSGYSTLPAASALPSTPQEIRRQMDELNKAIEAQKSQISSMTQNIVSASSEIGTSALANIALPSNLQQILDSIKTIGETTPDSGTSTPKDTSQAASDLTIPLMIPKTFTPRVPPPPIAPQQSQLPPLTRMMLDMPSDTIPLNLPAKPKIKPRSVNSPLLDEKLLSTPPPPIAAPSATPSVLGSLSEEDLIKKAAEMLGEGDTQPKKNKEQPAKKVKIDVHLPPVPGTEDDMNL